MKRMHLRKAQDRGMYLLMAGSLAVIIGALTYILVYILRNGLAMINLKFIFSSAQEGGIFPMIVTTLYLVLTAMVIALPVGIITAVYLNEYRNNSRAVRFIRLAVETLAGIPSILFGLFGLMLFSRVLGFGQSIIAGGLTLSIMILPVIIRTTEESLQAVPQGLREGSLALGTTQWQTIYRVVIPSALPGIVSASILAIGRIVGESAPVLLTVGIARNIPRSIFQSGRTLTIHLYYLTKEAIHPHDFEIAFATAAVLVVFVFLVNMGTRIISSRCAKNLNE